MADLPATPAFDEKLPLRIGACTLLDATPGQITWLAGFDGNAPVSPGETRDLGECRLVWFGPGQALAVGRAPELPGYARADMSDGFCVLRIEGATSRDVLSRLTPVDLRPVSFPVGRTARTLVGHMIAGVTRVGEDAYEIMVPRSMARTALHDLRRALTQVAGRAADNESS